MGRTRMQFLYIDNIKKWSRASLEENIRVAEDRIAWRKRCCDVVERIIPELTTPTKEK